VTVISEFLVMCDSCRHEERFTCTTLAQLREAMGIAGWTVYGSPNDAMDACGTCTPKVVE
jgi:hypothetical protein